MSRLAAIFILVALVAEPALAADPAFARVTPRGGTRGAEVELTFTGDRLDDAAEILFYDPGITVKELKTENAKTLKATVAIAPDARLGEYKLRVRTKTGVSPVRVFFVGPLPAVDEKEPNNDPEKPQAIDLNVTVAGVIENEGVDCFVVEAKKDQRLTAEVEGIRLNTEMLDPLVTILDEDRKPLASADDGSLLLQDPVVSVVAPKDGKYVVQIRDSAYGGNGNAAYRLHVGTFPRPRMVYPAGGQAGQDVSVQFIGDAKGSFTQTVKLPAGPNDAFAILPEQDGQVAPSANLFRVSPFSNVLETEPNDTHQQASLAGGELPLAFNGIIDKPGDADVFRFTAKKGQQFHVHCYARRLRSPLDPVVNVGDMTGKTLGGNDDAGGPDSYLRFAAPADGEYWLRVGDQLDAGGPDFVYRVEVTPVAPTLTLGIPFFDQFNVTQERQTIVVPKGNRFASLIRATRTDFGGGIEVSTVNLPDGVTATHDVVQDGVDVVPVVFEATADAPLAGTLATVTGKPLKTDVNVGTPTFLQSTVLVPNGNDPPFYTAEMNRLAVAVAEEAPFKISLVQPKAPIVQGGSMQLKVVAERKPGFDLPIRLQMVFNPPGVTSGGAEIDDGKAESFVPLNAADNAPAGRRWKVCVLGSADTPNGRVWVSTQLGELEVAAPMLAMKIDLATVERGKPGRVTVNVEEKTAFEGKAKVKLVGLPANVTATPDELELSPGEKTLTFNVTSTDKAPVGQHKSLLCVATVMKNGDPVIHNLARGGTLRVDAPPSPEQVAAKKNEAKPTGAKPQAAGKPLSRLEQLRQEAAARQGK